MIGQIFLLQLFLGQVIVFGNEEVIPSAAVTRLPSTYDCYQANIDAFQMAAEEGNDVVIEKFISCGLHPDSRHGMSHVTPLYLVATNGHDTSIKLLLDHGANIEAEVETIAGPLTLLSYAVYENNTLALTNLIDYGADVNRTCSSLNIAPIHWAVELDNKVAAEILIKQGADVNAKTGITERLESVYFYDYEVSRPEIDHDFENLPRQPLGIAVVRCSEGMVELLVNSGSLIDEIDGELSPLERALLNGCEKVVMKLFSLGVSTNIDESWTPLHKAVDQKMVEVVKYLINEGFLNTSDWLGRTPLHFAVQKDEKISKILLDHGADVNARDNGENTPLHNVRSLETAKLLLKRGADVNAKNYLGRTPLHVTTLANMSKLFLESRADINAQDNYGKTPLHVQAEINNVGVVNILLTYNASMIIRCQERNIFIMEDFKIYLVFLKIVKKEIWKNSTPIIGLTPTALAAGTSSEEVLSLLIKKNKSMLNLKNAEWPPLHVAVCTSDNTWYIDDYSNNITAHLKFLVDNDADVNIRDAYNLTALHKAIMAGRTIAVKALLSLKADLNAIDINGWTPLHAAAKQQDITIANILLSAGSDINIADRSGFTILMWAVMGYRPHFFKLMVDKTLELTSTNRYHYYSKMEGLSLAEVDEWMSFIHRYGQPESILDLKYDPYLVHRFDEIRGQHIDMVTMIAKKTDDLDVQDHIMGWTALHWAAASGDFDTVILLVERGAYLNHKSLLGHTPMLLARYWGQKGIYEYFKQLGAVW